MLGKILGHLRVAVAVGTDAREVLFADEQWRYTKGREEPLVGSGGEKVHAFFSQASREGAERLHGVRVEEGFFRVSQLGEGAEVVSKTVAVRHPSHGQEPSSAVDARFEIFDPGTAAPLGNDSELDASLLLELAVEDEARREVELVHDDVVAGLEIETATRPGSRTSSPEPSPGAPPEPSSYRRPGSPGSSRRRSPRPGAPVSDATPRTW